MRIERALGVRRGGRWLGLLAILVVGANSAVPAAHALPTAEITGEFGDSCRDFAARSSKEISHVAITYADGRVVKDEAIASRAYALDGGVGDEIDSVVVKSATTTAPFTCDDVGDAPPEAVLELQVTSTCGVVREDPPLMHCPTADTEARTEWTSFDGSVGWLLGDLCVNDPSLCRFTLRGTGSSDPDGDLMGWSVDFGDGTSATGDFATTPPTGLVLALSGCNQASTVTLTVSDSGGRTDSDSMLVFTGNCPD